MKVILAQLPKKVVFAYDGDMLLVNKEQFKEVVTRDAGRTIGEVFEEVFSEGRMRRKDYPELSYKLIDVSKLVEG